MPEQQLVEIACALGSGARIVIMDEPTASLTQKEQHLLFAVVRDLRKSGVGIIYISHRLEEIFALADRVTVLARWRERRHQPRRPDRRSRPDPDDGRPRSLPHSTPPTKRTGSRSSFHLKDVGSTAAAFAMSTWRSHAGEIVGLAGLVGAGRTELARILFGITPANAGEIFLDGRPLDIASPQEAIAQWHRLCARGPSPARRDSGNADRAQHDDGHSSADFSRAGCASGPSGISPLAFIRELAVKAYGPERRAAVSAAATSRRSLSLAGSRPSRSCSFSTSPPKASMSARRARSTRSSAVSRRKGSRC